MNRDPQKDKEIQQNINFAKVAEQTERYEDMVKYMK